MLKLGSDKDLSGEEEIRNCEIVDHFELVGHDFRVPEPRVDD